MPESFRLVVLSQESNVSNEAEIISDLFEDGLKTLHLRKPNSTIDEVRKLLKSIPNNFHTKIVIHSNYELLNDFDLRGAHLPESIRKEHRVNNSINVVSSSFHALKDIISEKMDFEYAFLSPIFQSVSKKGYLPALEQNIIQDFFTFYRNQIRFPVIALGGITDQNILRIKEMGFSGAATLGYIWENPNPVAQLKKLQKTLRG